MRRTIVALLCIALAAGSLTGCGDNKDKKEVPVNTEAKAEDKPNVESNRNPQQEEDKEDTKEDQKEEEKDNTDNSGQNEDSQDAKDTEEENEADMSEDLTMTTLKNSAGTIDYTSLEGLDLEAGGHIAVVVKSTKTAYWATVKKGMEAAVKDLNKKLEYKGDDKIKLSFEGPSDETDVESQINIIDAVLAENPGVLCLAAIDMESCQAQLETAEENGIPVVVLDSGVVTGTVNTVCSTDNQAAGAEAAKKLSEAIGGSGEIAVMAHIESSESSQDREKGFADEIAANHPGIKIVNISYENEETSVKEMAAKVLEENPNLKGYFCTNQITADDVLDALKEAGREDTAVVGFDAGKKQKEAIKDGRETGVIAQNPYGMGYATVVSAARAWLGLENDSFINPGYQWIDAASLDDEKLKNYLYE